ncbi:MAG: hypothetical protein IPL46_25970 [Saprospiraceae bacterium]|nr:hypothetical protein [Saprospiraceae bacterium]
MSILSRIQLSLLSSILCLTLLNAQNQIQVEAEIGTLSGVMLSKAKPGYSGEGYVSGFDGITDYLEVGFDVKLADLYKIEMVYFTTSSSNNHCRLQIDDQLYGEVRLSRSDTFIVANAGTYQFTTGIHTLRLLFGNASVEPDFFRLTPVSGTDWDRT